MHFQICTIMVIHLVHHHGGRCQGQEAEYQCCVYTGPLMRINNTKVTAFNIIS